MSIFGCKPCQPSDPATDTVKVNAPTMEVPLREEEIQEAQALAAAEEEAKRQAEEAAMEAARRLAAEEEARRRAELERQQEQIRRAQALAEEEARRRHEEAERLRQAEEKLAQEKRRRKEAVDAFLKANKFKGVGIPKKSMLSTTYALHCAVEKVDVHMVEDLIKEGADAQQKNSNGRTPAQLAQKKNKNGSHTVILQILEA